MSRIDCTGLKFPAEHLAIKTAASFSTRGYCAAGVRGEDEGKGDGTSRSEVGTPGEINVGTVKRFHPAP